MHKKPGQYTNLMSRDYTISLKLPEKTLKTRVARQDPRYRSSESGRMQSVKTVLKLSQLKLTGHVTKMPDERLSKKVFYGELQGKKRI